MQTAAFKLEMWSLLYQLKSGMQNFLEPILESENLTYFQTHILIELLTTPTTNITRLSKEFGINQGNVSTMCKQMEKQGLLRRVRSVEDERVVQLTLTDAGRTKIQGLLAHIDSMSDRLESISSEQLDTILKGMHELTHLLNALAVHNHAPKNDIQKEGTTC